MSKNSSNPVRELRYVDNDASIGVPMLQKLGVKYAMVFTADAKREADANTDRRLQQLNKQMRADLDHFRRTLQEQKEAKMLQIQNELGLQLKQKRAEFEQMKLENRAKDDQSKQALLQAFRKRAEVAREKV